MSGPTRRTLPLKRSYDEITTDDDSSDDDVYHPEVITVAKHMENVLIGELAEEREKNRVLEARLDDWIQNYTNLCAEFSQYQDVVCYRYLLIIAALVGVIVTLPFVMCM